MPRKRTYTEMEAAEPPPPEKKEPSLLQNIRNMWEFASVMQYIFIFGKAVKIDEDFDVEDFEEECLRPGYSEKLEEIGLTLLKWISSHRGLNYDIWDEYTRRQYLSKAPHLNPYGDDEEPKKFRSFDIFQKIRILHQLTVWTLWNPDRLRERMVEHPREVDQLEWRIEEIGYDREDRQYYLLDDNRLYRRTEPELPPLPKAKPKANSKKAIAARRRAARLRKLEDSPTPDVEESENGIESIPDADNDDSVIGVPSGAEADTFGGFKWECIAITLDEYQQFCDSLKKAKDPDEKALRDRILEEVLPVIEAAAEKQKRKIERREKELLVLERMAGAKRSSRIADKHDRERREQEMAEAERKRAFDLAAAHREKEKQEQMELDRQSRMMTREQRIRDREFKRLLKEEELARDAEEQKKIEEGHIRGSERQIRERIEKNKKELEDLNAEDEWTFDCSGCGVHGKNIDDGSHSVACERCNVWQHSKCLGISESEAEKDDFHFVCRDCKRKEEEAKRPKISLKFKVGSSVSPAPPSPARPRPVSPNVQRPVSSEAYKYPTSPSPRQILTTNGYQQSSPSNQNVPPTYPRQPAPYPRYGPQQLPYSPPRYPYVANGQQHTPNANISTVQMQNNGTSNIQHPTNVFQPRPATQANTYNPNPYIQASPYRQVQQNPAPVQSSSYPNGIGFQQHPFPANPRPTSSHSPQPPPATSLMGGTQPNGYTPSAARLPSPIVNRPTMSPTQGNYDVGPVAGIQYRSPSLSYQQMSQSSQANAITPSSSQSQSEGTVSFTTPRPATSHPPPTHLSGLSPTKQMSATPPSNHNIPVKSDTSSSPPTIPSARSVSGIPILPPIQHFAPSPEQLHKSPVPTPSKQLTPAKVGEDELRRTHEQAHPPPVETQPQSQQS